MVSREAFLEHARVFDNWYGTGREHVEGLLAGGHSVVLEIDWQGARQVRERAPESRSIFILPPSVAELERRLRGRETDSRGRDLAQAARMRSGTWLTGRNSTMSWSTTISRRRSTRLAAVIAGAGEDARTDTPAVQAAAAAIVAGR